MYVADKLEQDSDVASTGSLQGWKWGGVRGGDWKRLSLLFAGVSESWGRESQGSPGDLSFMFIGCKDIETRKLKLPPPWFSFLCTLDWNLHEIFTSNFKARVIPAMFYFFSVYISWYLEQFFSLRSTVTRFKKVRTQTLGIQKGIGLILFSNSWTIFTCLKLAGHSSAVQPSHVVGPSANDISSCDQFSFLIQSHLEIQLSSLL